MNRLFIILCVLICIMFLPSGAGAQHFKHDSIFFTGAVMDQKELTPLPNAHYRVNDNRVGLTNSYGRFSFWVNVGDTVLYSYVGYHKVKVIISDTLNQDQYLFGVFLSKDTVALQEVLILPRFGNLKDAFIHANVNTREYVSAKNNVNSVTYQALTTAPKTMDAKANTDMQIKQFQTSVEYKGMVAPNNMVGISTQSTLSEIKRIKRNRKKKISRNLITDKELDILKKIYGFSR